MIIALLLFSAFFVLPILKEATKKSEKTLVISDGVFSMDGDIAPLDEITKLAREYGAMTYIDDCHGEGVLAGGRGIGAQQGKSQ